MCEIAELDVNANLVVLSSCDTCYGRVLTGSGAFSHARPFLIAGADQVLASFWRIEDARAARFMTRFYQHLLTAVAQMGKLTLYQVLSFHFLLSFIEKSGRKSEIRNNIMTRQ